MSPIPHSLLSPASDAWRLLNDAARDARMVVFCGVPGVGKSFLLREQVRIAAAAGRKVSLLQWDVSRQVFEVPDVLRRYPEVGGSTHAMIRRAVGLWSREAVSDWMATHPDPRYLLVMEAPLVGGRLAELARRVDDRAEALLSRPDVRFYIPTPTAEVRRAIEAARRAETTSNRHARDAANAVPAVVDELWQMVADTARKMRIEFAGALSSYSPEAYFAVYRAVLRHRNVSKVMIDEIVCAGGSPHDRDEPLEELAPTAALVPDLIARAEREGDEWVAARALLWYET
jgi:hypothetical protein